jgi:hypothetical protein
MSSPLSMRTFRASRFMHVMALFAWLMLVVVSLPSVAMGADMSHGDMPATMGSMMGHGMQPSQPASGHRAQDCCGNPAHADCHCDAMCGNVLLPSFPVLSGTHAPADGYATLYGVDAPTPDPIPPLRPPTA